MAVPDSTLAIDQRLVALGDVVERMGSVLVDLEANPARVLLPTAPLTGVTASSWAETDAQLTLLWQLYPVARDAVSRMTVERGTRQALDATERSHLAAELTGPCVTLDAELSAAIRDSGAVSIDLPAPCSLDQLTAVFDVLHQRVATALGDVERVWDRLLPSLTAFDQELTEIEAEAAAQGARPPNDVAVTRRSIERLRARAAGDPLDLDLDELEIVRASVLRAHQAVTGVNTSGARHGELLAEAAVVLDAIEADLADAEEARAEAVQKILGADALPSITDEQELARQMRVELDRLEASTDDDGQTANRQLDRLVQNCTRLHDRVGQMRALVSSGVVQRDELRRRLEGYRVKAQAAGRAEDLELDAHYRQANDQLYVAPCDVDAAARAVDAYQHAVNRRPAPEDRR